MSYSYIAEEIKRFVKQRAGSCCEYCGEPDFVGLAAHQFDHIISEKLGGDTHEDNLAYCCILCNRHKGSNISSYAGSPRKNIPLFNPRIDVWEEHFYYTDDGNLNSKTDAGQGTIFVLKINESDRVKDRKIFFEDGFMELQ